MNPVPEQPEFQRPAKPAGEWRGGGVPSIPDHELFRCVGRGSYGEVWLARSVMGTFRAVKVVHRKKFEHDRPYEREFSGIKRFEPISRTHEGLTDILQVGRNDQEQYFYYVMELADDTKQGQQIDPGSYEPKTLAEQALSRKVPPFADCLRLSLALTSAVSHLHQHRLIHRDIKPSNIIFVNGVPKLADIGLVTTVGANTIPGGTLGYIAPEGAPSPQADLYSLGKVLYEISTGKDRQEYPELPTMWGTPDEQPKFAELNEIILKACENNPDKRYQTAADLYADLVLLEAGKSIKRLRTLERRLALFTKAALVAVVLASLATLEYYRIYRARQRETRLLADSYVAAGTRSANEGDLLGSLPWYAGALNLDQKDAERARRDRIRIALTLQQYPKMVQMIFLDGEIKDSEFSPDGRWVVFADSRGVCSVWDVAKGEKLIRLEGHSREVETASFSRDGRFIVTASEDQTARVWNTESRRETLRLPHPKAVLSARFSPSGDRIVTGCADGLVRIWDVANPLEPMIELRHPRSVRHAAFSPDGSLIVTACENGAAVVWDWVKKIQVATLAHPPLSASDNWIFHACFSPDGQLVATASFDSTARIWKARTGQQLHILVHKAPVRSVEFTPDGTRVITGCDDYTIRTWDVASGEEAMLPLSQSSYLGHVSMNPEGCLVVSGSAEGVGCIWNIALNHSYPRRDPVVFDQRGDRSATIESGLVRFTEVTKSNSVPVELHATGTVRDVKLNRDGTRALLISAEAVTAGVGPRSAQLWDAVGGKPLSASFSYANSIFCLSPDASRMLTGTKESDRAEVWDTAAGKPVFAPLLHAEGVKGAAFNTDSSRLLTWGGSNAYVWNASTGRQIFMRTHRSLVSHAEFSPDGRRWVTACSDTSLARLDAQVWDSQTGQPVGPPLRHGNDGIVFAAFSPDGKRIVTAGEDRTAIIWDAESGNSLCRALHKDVVEQAAFSPDGRWFVTACADNTARVWDATTGIPITPPLKHNWILWHARFIDNGQSILAKRLKGDEWVAWDKGRDPQPKEWMIWKLAPDPRPTADLILLTQLLSSRQIDSNGEPSPLAKETLSGLWHRFRSLYPTDFSTAPSRDDLIKWHELEAEARERAAQWFGARFHIDRLIALKSDDPTLQTRRAQAQAELERSARSAANP